MTIRTRLTVWYAACSVGSVLLMAAVLYYELVVEQRATKLKELPAEAIEGEVGEIIFFWAVPAALITIFGGWWALRQALSPLGRLTAAAERIHADNLRNALPRTDKHDEIDRLAEVLNAMTVRLHDSFERVRDFTLHASHELKTPLTVMRHELDTALREPLGAMEHERYAALLDEIDRLTQIVDGLMFLVKTDAGLLVLEKTPVDLHELVREAYEDAEVLAQAERIEVSLDSCGSIKLIADRRRLRQLLLILSDNAIKYNYPNGKVLIALLAADGMATIIFSNTGAGVPPEFASRVFDRFFRGATTTTPKPDGCGLGLTIARGIVEAHGGTMSFRSEPCQLTTVTLLLPGAVQLDDVEPVHTRTHDVAIETT